MERRETAALYAGFATSVIDPPLGMKMAGYRMRKGGAKGIHDSIQAGCAYLSDGTTEIALVSLDLLALQPALSSRIKTAVQASAGINGAYCILSCTHTHSSADVYSFLNQDPQRENYEKHLTAAIVETVLQAKKKRQKCSSSIVQREVDNIAFNRRIKLKNGKTVNNLEFIENDIIQSAGPVDPVTTAVFFENGREVAGVLVNFTLHATVLNEDNLFITRDYPGYMVDYISANIPGDPAVLFFNGAFGNINQIGIPGEWISTFDEAKRIGETVGEIVVNAYTGRENFTPVPVVSKQSIISVAHKQPDIDKDGFETLQQVEELIRRLSMQCEETDNSDHRYRLEKEILFFKEALHLLQMETTEPAELHVLSVGELEIIALPGEVFVEYGLNLKQSTRKPYSIVCGNTDGSIGYVPTREAFEEGAYETRISSGSRVASDTGERIMKEVEKIRNAI